MSKEIQNKLAASGLVPVVVLEDANDALPTAKALLAGGLCVMEITFRTACAAEAISLVAENCPEMKRPWPAAQSLLYAPALMPRSWLGV